MSENMIAPFICDNCGQHGTAEEVLAGNAKCTRCKSGIFESFTIDDAEVIASLRTQLQEAQAEIAAKNTALGVDKVQLIEEIHRMEGEKDTEVGYWRERCDHLFEDSARAENARMEAEKPDESGDAELQEMFNQCETDDPDVFKRVKVLAFLGVSRQTLFSALMDYVGLLIAAEKRSQFNKDNHLAAEKEIDRLSAELSTLRRESVRVDVLLRWTKSRSRVLSILGGAIMSRAGSNPGEQAKALLSWLTAILDRRQSRSTTNTKGE